MRKLDVIRADKRIKSMELISGAFIRNAVAGELKLPLCKGSYIFAWDETYGDGRKVEHLSFAPYNPKHTPSWDELCRLKETFWEDEEECFQLFPKRSEYVNIKENCLHIWRFKE